MEAYADAVFAIAFTLPVVEIVLPHATDGAGLSRDLVELWPSYFGYALSSAVIGLYWVHHHFSGAVYRTTGHWFLVASVVFLAVIAFIAFPARVFADHVWDPDTRIPATRLWVGSCAALSLAWLGKWTVGLRRRDVDRRLTKAYVHRLNRRYGLFAAANVLAAGLAWVRWEAGLALSTILTLSLLWPPATPEYDGEAPVVEGEE